MKKSFLKINIADTHIFGVFVNVGPLLSSDPNLLSEKQCCMKTASNNVLGYLEDLRLLDGFYITNIPMGWYCYDTPIFS